MGTARNATQQQLFELVHHARTTLGMPVAFLTRMDATTQTLEVVDSKIPFLFQEGYQQQRDQTLCQAAIDGKVPPVMGDLTKHKVAMQLPAARFPRLRSFVTVPVHLSDGSLYGSFCAAGVTTNDDLRARDAELMSLLAQAAAVIVEPEVAARRQTAEIEDRYAPVLTGGGPQIVYQPIVDLRTRRRVGSEALSRFPREWGKAPDVCFAEAFQAGFGEKLEFLTLRRAGSAAPTVGGYLSLNVCVPTITHPDFPAVMAPLLLTNIVLEITEQHAVDDYNAILRRLTPLREQGMRLAIDDVGVGYSSLKHLVTLAPDVMKLDRSIIDGVAKDPILESLIRSMVSFAGATGARLVAEGIEDEVDGALLADIGVDYGQGWLFGKPMALEDLEPC